MKIWILIMSIICLLTFPVSAAEYAAPVAPEAAQPYMPDDQQSLGQGLWHILKTAISKIEPEITEASSTCLAVIVVVLIMYLLQSISEKANSVIQLTGTVIIGTLLLSPINSLITAGSNTVKELTDYGKLLMPIMTTALAAQGGTTSSSVLYSGTIFFNAVLSGLITNIITPALYIYLCISVVNSAVSQDILKKIKKFLKWLMTWTLKIVLYVFTGYISITGVISGSIDASALKATKLTISGVVPVIGNILSDATESILISAGVVKNSVGLYGIFAIIALCVEPFVVIGTRYILLKFCAAVCSILGNNSSVSLVEDFSTGMGYVLAMTASVCIMLLISIVCFLRGVGL